MTSPRDIRLRGRNIDLNDRMGTALGIANGELREATLGIHASDLPATRFADPNAVS
jgi:hypothetical protein